MRARHATQAGLSWALLSILPLAAEPPAARPENVLRYGERALQADDFQAAVPDKRPVEDPRAEAYSHTSIRYHYQARETRRRRQVELQLTGIKLYAVFERAQSWIALPEAPDLLEHHEGHFDLTHIAALQAQIDFQNLIRTMPPTGRGKTELEARRDLDAQLQNAVDRYRAEWEPEHRYFDERTRYGTDAIAERKERDKQRAKLAELRNELQPRPDAGRPKRRSP